MLPLGIRGPPAITARFRSQSRSKLVRGNDKIPPATRRFLPKTDACQGRDRRIKWESRKVKQRETEQMVQEDMYSKAYRQLVIKRAHRDTIEASRAYRREVLKRKTIGAFRDHLEFELIRKELRADILYEARLGRTVLRSMQVTKVPIDTTALLRRMQIGLCRRVMVEWSLYTTQKSLLDAEICDKNLLHLIGGHIFISWRHFELRLRTFSQNYYKRRVITRSMKSWRVDLKQAELLEWRKDCVKERLRLILRE